MFCCLVVVFGLDACPYYYHLIRVNLCNLWILLKDWIPGRSLGCRSLFGRGNGVACWGETSGLCGKRTLPPPRDDTVNCLADLFRGNLFTISPFTPQKHLSTFSPQKHLSTFKNPADPVDPVIRVLSSRHPFMPLSFDATGAYAIFLRSSL